MQSNAHIDGKKPKLLLHALHGKSAVAAREKDFAAVSLVKNSTLTSRKTKETLGHTNSSLKKKKVSNRRDDIQ